MAEITSYEELQHLNWETGYEWYNPDREDDDRTRVEFYRDVLIAAKESGQDTTQADLNLDAAIGWAMLEMMGDCGVTGPLVAQEYDEPVGNQFNSETNEWYYKLG